MPRARECLAVATLLATSTYKYAQRDGSAVLSGLLRLLDQVYVKEILVPLD